MKKTTKTIGQWQPLTILLSFVCAAGATLDLGNLNPHAPIQQSWEVLNEKGNIVWATTAVHPLWTWWPDLTPDVCKLVAGSPIGTSQIILILATHPLRSGVSQMG